MKLKTNASKMKIMGEMIKEIWEKGKTGREKDTSHLPTLSLKVLCNRCVVIP